MQYNLHKAQQLDAQDELGNYREKFHFPKQKNGEDYLYFCGNSLGLQPKITKEYVDEVMQDWANLAVEGHFYAKHSWMNYHELFSETLAKIVGAKRNEVVCMNTLTANLHFLLVSFYRPTEKKFKILMESDAFPSDKYVMQSQARFHGYDPNEAIIYVAPREGETLLRNEDIIDLIEKQGDEIALILFGGINYYTGQLFDLQKITEIGHQKNCIVGFDLAHAAGNVPLQLNAWNVDFAAWCTYKYMNSGPGSLGAIYVNEKFLEDKTIQRFEGWWGTNKQTRFNMRLDFDAIPTAESWQVSNAPILSMAGVRASMSLFEEVGMEKLRQKSKLLTEYLLELLTELPKEKINIITPKNWNERGCQTSIQVKNADKTLFYNLLEKGVLGDWREPDVIRISPAPFYNSFEDCYKLVEILKTLL